MFPYRKLKAKFKNLFRVGKKGVMFKKPTQNGEEFQEMVLTSAEIQKFYKDKENLKQMFHELSEELQDIQEFEDDMVEYVRNHINIAEVKTISGDVFINQKN